LNVSTFYYVDITKAAKAEAAATYYLTTTGKLHHACCKQLH